MYLASLGSRSLRVCNIGWSRVLDGCCLLEVGQGRYQRGSLGSNPQSATSYLEGEEPVHVGGHGVAAAVVDHAVGDDGQERARLGRAQVAGSSWQQGRIETERGRY